MSKQTKKLADELEAWVNHWYGYSFNAPEAKAYPEMAQLREIIRKLRQ